MAVQSSVAVQLLEQLRLAFNRADDVALGRVWQHSSSRKIASEYQLHFFTTPLHQLQENKEFYVFG